MKHGPLGSRSGGYVMFLAAAVIASISLALLVTARVQGDISPALHNLQRDVEREIAAQTVAGRVAFLLLSEPIGPRSIIVGGSREPETATTPFDANLHAASGVRAAELRLDGRLYRVRVGGAPRDVFVSLQDEAGLFNLNTGDDGALSALLTQIGEPARAGQRLAAVLDDYIDEDDLNRPGGAERDDYRRLRLAAPGNGALTSRWEALNALGWATSLSQAQRNEFWRLVAVAPAGQGVNVNTAPTAVLQSIVGDPRTVSTLERRREQSALTGTDDIEALAGMNSRPAGAILAAQPGVTFRLVVSFEEADRAGRRALESQLALTGPDADRPFYWREGWRELAGALDDQRRKGERDILPEGAIARAP